MNLVSVTLSLPVSLLIFFCFFQFRMIISLHTNFKFFWSFTMFLKKVITFFLLMSLPYVCLYGMQPAIGYICTDTVEEFPTITQPYSPSFAERHPIMWGLIKTGVCTAAAYCLGNCQQAVPACAIAAGGLVTAGTMSTLSYAKNKYRFLHSLLLHPIGALNTIYKTYSAYNLQLSKIEEGKLSIDEDQRKAIPIVLKLIHSYEKICPVYFVGECVREDWWDCILSRRFEPSYRESFEQKVVHALIGCLDRNGARPVQYVGFGCGGTFQDFVIAVKTLAQKPDASLVIHLIDRQYTPCVCCLELLNNSHEIVPEIANDYYSVMPLAKQKYRVKWQAQDVPDVKFENAVVGESLRIEIHAKQFLAYIQKTFPRAHIVLCLHYDKQNYLEYIEKYHLHYPDVIAAADIQDEMSLLAQAPIHYASLCSEVLQKHPTSQNFWLSRWQDVKIQQLGLTECPDAKLEKFGNTDLYVSSQKLKAPTRNIRRYLRAKLYPYVQ